MHVADLALTEQGSGTEGDRGKVRTSLEPFVTECGAIGPELYPCTMAAKTLAEVSTCQPRSNDAK